MRWALFNRVELLASVPAHYGVPIIIRSPRMKHSSVNLKYWKQSWKIGNGF
jgi:hypothetical protein